MDKQEFIAELRRAMSGDFSTSEIEETASYYEDYITMQAKKGKQEDEVLRELGSPRLIAKSMRAAGENAGGSVHGSTRTQRGIYGNAGGAGGRNGGRAAGSGSAYDEDAACNGGMHTFRVPIWLILLVVLLLLFAVLTIIFRVLVALLPIILVAAGIIAIYRFFSKK